MRPALVILGNLLVDDVVLPDGRTRMGQPGGAILYAALAAALWTDRVGCVSLAGSDYPAPMLDALARREVDLAGVKPQGGPGLRTWLLYEDGVRRVVHRLAGPSHADVSPLPRQIPAAWRKARAFHVAPMPLESQRALAAAGGATTFVSVDPHVPVTDATLGAWRSLLARVHAFFPGEDELQLEGVAADPRAALAQLAGGRLRFVAWKRGAAGGLLFDAETRRFHAWEGRAREVVDPTGAGDAFAAGFLTAHLDGRSVEESLQRAVVTASFALESWGPAALLEATRADAEARLREWFGAGAVRERA